MQRVCYSKVMAMKFETQKKGEQFLVVNKSTGDVRGRAKTEGEANLLRDRLQKEHNDGVEQASARLTPPASVTSDGTQD